MNPKDFPICVISIARAVALRTLGVPMGGGTNIYDEAEIGKAKRGEPGEISHHFAEESATSKIAIGKARVGVKTNDLQDGFAHPEKAAEALDAALSELSPEDQTRIGHAVAKYAAGCMAVYERNRRETRNDWKTYRRFIRRMGPGKKFTLVSFEAKSLIKKWLTNK